MWHLYHFHFRIDGDTRYVWFASLTMRVNATATRHPHWQAQVAVLAVWLFCKTMLAKQHVQQSGHVEPEPASALGDLVFDGLGGDSGVESGGEAVVVPGEGAGGWYISPTIIDGLPLQCRTNQEEIFGPVVTIQPFHTDEEAIALANGTNYGLSATVWTNNLRRTQRLAVALQAGIVWVNTWMLRDLRTPFGGVKDSGIGREGGWDALRFFTEAKNVTLGE